MEYKLEIKDNSENKSTKYDWNKKDVEEFRIIVKNEENLVSRLDDDFLLSCLRARKYNLERALELVKKYYDSKRKYPLIFQKFGSPSVARCLRKDVVGYLPNSDHLGRIIAIVKLTNWDTTEISMVDIISTGLLYGDLLLNNNLVQVNGVVIIINLLGLSIKHIMQVTPRVSYQTITAGSGSYPISYKEVHFVNVNYLFYPAFSIILPFLPHKIKKRVHIHTGVDTLHKHIPKKYLPSDLGGDIEDTSFTYSSQEFRSNEEFFRESEKYWGR